MTASSTDIDLARLFKLRLVVARHGEMDAARWWNTNGILGRRGSAVLKRGFPSTHYFAQARVVFAVARSRCHELFDPPGCMTLWNLPADIEDQFDERWQDWLDEGDQWEPVFEKLSKRPSPAISCKCWMRSISPTRTTSKPSASSVDPRRADRFR